VVLVVSVLTNTRPDAVNVYKWLPNG